MEREDEELHEKVINTIEFIKQSYKKHGGYEDPVEVFKWGNCGNFCTFLLEEFGEDATPCGIYKDNKLEHIITKIKDRYYDVEGEVSPKSYVSYLMGVRLKDYGMEGITTDVNRYSIKGVEEKEIEKNTDNYGAQVVIVNNEEPKKTPSTELGRMAKIKEDLEKRRKGVIGDDEHGGR